jgi:hypothetical protein
MQMHAFCYQTWGHSYSHLARRERGTTARGGRSRAATQAAGSRAPCGLRPEWVERLLMASGRLLAKREGAVVGDKMRECWEASLPSSLFTSPDH